MLMNSQKCCGHKQSLALSYLSTTHLNFNRSVGLLQHSIEHINKDILGLVKIIIKIACYDCKILFIEITKVNKPQRNVQVH